MLRKALRPSARTWVLFCWLLLAGCLPVLSGSTPIPPQPSATLTPPATSTPTVIWFPSTSTPTPFSPTLPVTPTLELRPEQGELLFSDDFQDGSDWVLGQTATTSIAVGNHALTLALDQPDGYIYTLRNSPLLGDFYLEVTASPTLCRAADEYGLLLRVSENLDFLRFSLSCDGYVRLDKYFGGKASSPIPKSMSGAVPPGAPSSSRLAVWAKGKEMRFYINDQYQFTIRDGTLLRGSLGFFIRSGGENAVTVSFSELSVSKVVD
jgi:hypothetical protein